MQRQPNYEKGKHTEPQKKWKEQKIRSQIKCGKAKIQSQRKCGKAKKYRTQKLREGKQLQGQIKCVNEKQNKLSQ